MRHPEQTPKGRRVHFVEVCEDLDIGRQRYLAAPPVGPAGLLHQGDGLAVDNMSGDASDVDLGGLQSPAQFPAQEIDGKGLADILGSGKYGCGAEQGRHLFGEGIGPAHMAG